LGNTGWGEARGSMIRNCAERVASTSSDSAAFSRRATIDWYVPRITS
jgi:hypothetical protein